MEELSPGPRTRERDSTPVPLLASVGTPVVAYIHKGRQTEACTYELKHKNILKIKV